MNDPIFFCGEAELLRRLKLGVISENLECRLKCQVHFMIIIPMVIIRPLSIIDVISTSDIELTGAHPGLPAPLPQAAHQQPFICQLVL